MTRLRFLFASRLVLVATAAWLFVCPIVCGQGGGGGGQGGGGQGGGGGGGQNNTIAGVSGVFIDSAGILRTKVYGDKGGKLSQMRVQEAQVKLDPKIASTSKLRKVSLTRLEQALAVLRSEGKKPTDEMLNLAGITRIQYVFLYPETNDLVIAGPAEGWATDLSGRVLGIESGRPTVRLEDLVVALRAHPANGQAPAVISCSIDATKQGLANMQQYFSSVASRVNAGNAQMVARGMRDALGLQNVTIKGVSPKTHFAKILVEADYRMKLIGIGLERTPVKLASYVDLAKSKSTSANAMQRWWFVPKYDCVRVAEDDLSMELVGEAVKLVGANEVVGSDGTRFSSGKSDSAGKRFVEGFTKKYPEIAAAVPVYAELRNLIDLSVVAAFIQKHDYFNRIGWDMKTFGDEAVFSVENELAPERVESAVNAVAAGKKLMFPIGGGVRIETQQALESGNLLKDEDGKINNARQNVRLDQLHAGQWWWD